MGKALSALTATLASAGLFACGGDGGPASPGPPSAWGDPPRRFCPPAPRLPRKHPPAARRLIGLPVARANRVARASGYRVRTIERDGKALNVTMDLRIDRINVAVRGNRISRVFGVC